MSKMRIDIKFTGERHPKTFYFEPKAADKLLNTLAQGLPYRYKGTVDRKSRVTDQYERRTAEHIIMPFAIESVTAYDPTSAPLD
jgi:hypothetical protein